MKVDIQPEYYQYVRRSQMAYNNDMSGRLIGCAQMSPYLHLPGNGQGSGLELMFFVQREGMGQPQVLEFMNICYFV